MKTGQEKILAEPHAEYSRRLTERRAEVARLDGIAEQISRGRLAAFLLGVALWWFAVRPETLSGAWLSAPVFVFVGLLLSHERIRRASLLAKRGVDFYEKGLARLEDRWAGSGVDGMRFLESGHLYAQDLDLFGRGSLFELLCTARTQGGEQTLADWLCAPAQPEEIRARQEAVAELRDALNLRESLALKGEAVRASVHPETLIAWTRAPLHVSSLRGWRLFAFMLSIANVTTLLGWLAFAMSPLPFFLMVIVSTLMSLRLRTTVPRILSGVAQAERDLPLLSDVLSCFEDRHFSCPKLTVLRAALDTKGSPPSRQIARLGRLVNLLESGKNQIFIPIAALLLWPVQIALAIESWRVETGDAIGRWLEAVGEFEALCALAGYAYEHADDPFPEIVTTEACFEGEELGHPLLPTARCVRNNISLTSPLQALVVSGSNMSGKSTFLRTVGINAVLAFTGAPVRARRLRLSPLAIGATLRIQDSLQEGSSRFYAEISRLSHLMDLTKAELPLLFLLDEILHGTNSHDRQIGAEAIVRGFIERGAIGLVTTHDLALAQVADALAPRAANVHFEDHFTDGKLVFDYLMRPGVVRKSNALALMRSVGLEVN